MVEIVPFQPAFLRGAQALSAAEGWPHTVDDWAFLLNHGKGLAALAGDRVCGTVLGFRQGGCATLGMVIVAPALRGHGLGKRLMKAAMNDLSMPAYTLVATPEGEPLYRSMGFKDTGAIEQCQGYVSASVGPGTARPLTRSDWPEVLQLDHRASNRDREGILRGIFARGQLWGINENSALSAYCLARPSGNGIVIGPIVAKDQEQAKSLIQTAVQADPGAFYRIDTDPVLGLVGWLEGLGLQMVARSTVMAYGPLPQTELGSPKIYGLSSQALG